MSAHSFGWSTGDARSGQSGEGVPQKGGGSGGIRMHTRRHVGLPVLSKRHINPLVAFLLSPAAIPGAREPRTETDCRFRGEGTQGCPFRNGPGEAGSPDVAVTDVTAGSCCAGVSADGPREAVGLRRSDRTCQDPHLPASESGNAVPSTALRRRARHGSLPFGGAAI